MTPVAPSSQLNRLFGLEGRVAVVTGGRRGLGKAMVLGLVQAGARVAAVARSPEAGDLAEEVRAQGGSLLYIQADLADRAERKGIIDRITEHFGRLDVLVNNAGYQHQAPAMEYPAEQWDEDLELLLTAILDLSQQAAAYMSAHGGGKIIHIASVSSFQGARNIIGYTTAKHGLIGLTKAMANEWAPLNINVNAIAPGVFETDMAKDLLSDPVRCEAMRGRIPDGRFGKPGDIVGPLLFLAGDASSHVHGHILLVDGGWMGR